MSLIKENKLLFIRILLCVFILGLLVHGYRYFNADFSHDSLTAINHFDNDRLMKRATGRFAGIANIYFRGHLSAPWLLGAISLFWTAVNCFILAKVFAFAKSSSIYALCAICVTSMSFIYTHASFVHEIDLYALAFLMASLSIYCFAAHRYGYLLTILFTCLTCFTYQPYFAVSVTMAVMLTIKRMVEGERLSTNLTKSAKLCLCLLLGTITYMALFKLSAVLMPGYISTQGYNNPSSVVGDHSLSILDRLAFTYQEFAYRMFDPNTYHPWAVALCHLLLMVFSVALCAVMAYRRKLSFISILVLILLLGIIPFSITIVSFIASNMTHQLIQCATIMILLFPLILLSGHETRKIPHRVALVLIGMVVWCNSIFAHHVYLAKTLIEKQTLSLMTRVTADIESMPDYQLGVTPVVFIGHWEDSHATKLRNGFSHTERGFGLGYRTAVEMRAPEHISSYYQNYLGMPAKIKVLNKFSPLSDQLRQRIAEMPLFPKKGYCQMIDGSIFVKISNLDDAHILLDSRL